MTKRKIDPSLEGRGFSTKDLLQRRVSFLLGSDPKVIGSVEFPICTPANQDSTPPEGTSKTGYQPKGILKKPNNNGLGWDAEDPSQRTPPENVITVDNGELNNSQNTFLKRRARIAPCSRQKLVQVPGSFSYRRLLPYLTEMDKDEVQVSSTEEKSIAPNVDSRDSILAVNLNFAEIPVSILEEMMYKLS